MGWDGTMFGEEAEATPICCEVHTHLQSFSFALSPVRTRNDPSFVKLLRAQDTTLSSVAVISTT